MATERERMLDDAETNGFDEGAIVDSGNNDRAQRAYIALKLFQIERHLRRMADAAELGFLEDRDASGCG